jgi:hypothetical protein
VFRTKDHRSIAPCRSSRATTESSMSSPPPWQSRTDGSKELLEQELRQPEKLAPTPRSEIGPLSSRTSSPPRPAMGEERGNLAADGLRSPSPPWPAKSSPSLGRRDSAATDLLKKTVMPLPPPARAAASLETSWIWGQDLEHPPSVWADRPNAGRDPKPNRKTKDLALDYSSAQPKPTSAS